MPKQVTRPDFNPQISLAQSSNSEDRRDLPFCRRDFRSVVSVVSNENVSDLNNFPNLFKKGKFKCIKKQSNVQRRKYSQVKRTVVSILVNYNLHYKNGKCKNTTANMPVYISDVTKYLLYYRNKHYHYYYYYVCIMFLFGI